MSITSVLEGKSTDNLYLPRPASGSFERYYLNNLSPEKLFGLGSDPYSGGGWYLNNVQIPRRDEVLNQKFGGTSRAIEGYMRLLNDAQVLASFQKFISEITQRPFSVLPASTSEQDEYIAEFVRQCIFRLGLTARQSISRTTIAYNSEGFNAIVRALAESYLLGISGAGIVWVKQGKHILPSYVQPVDPRRIEITMNERGDVYPKLAVWQEGYLGKPLPARTFILHRFWSNSSYQDPWGYGLGRQLYPLVEFRRNLMSLWLQFCDKNTTPNVVINYPLGISKQDHQNLLEIGKTFGQGSVALFPEGVQANYLTPSGAAPGVYRELIAYLDQQISWLITGERDPAQSGQVTGSLAQSERLADSVRVKKAKFFNDSLETTLNNTLVRWIVELNFGLDVNPPKVVRNFSDLNDRTNKQAILSQISMLKGLGYVVNDIDWLKEQVDIPSLAYDPAMIEATQGQDLPTEGDREDVAPTEEMEGEGSAPPSGTEGFSERRAKQYSFLEREDNTDQVVSLATAATILGVDPEVMKDALGLADENQLVDINELLEEFLESEEELTGEVADEGVQQISGSYRDKVPSVPREYYGLSTGLHSTNEAPDKMENLVSSKETASELVAKSLKGQPRQIGFDSISSSVTPYEESVLNLYVTKDTPVYEILYAIAESLDEIRVNQAREITFNMHQTDWDRWSKYQNILNRLQAMYTHTNVKYEALILKEELREFEYILKNGYRRSPYSYIDELKAKPTKSQELNF